MARGPTSSDRTSDTWIEQAGVFAAEAGHKWHSNPYLRRENMPARTGESLQEWSRKHDAWQRGFERQYETEPAGKERLGRETLASVVERRVRWIPAVRDELARHPASTLQLEMPYSHARDALGRNWDVDSFQCGTVQVLNCQAAFRTTVDQLRDAFDLA